MKSIGDILRKAREKKRLTIEDVSKYIKIQTKYLRSMENDEYRIFSGKVHSKGFLKVYAEFLNLNVDEIIALWRRDYEKDFEKAEIKGFKISKELEKPNLIVTPSTLIILTVVGFLLIFFGYLFYQYKTYTGTPNLEVFSPQENLVASSDILDITGKTDLDSKVYVNNQEIILGPDGSFARSVKLKEGLNTISIRSVNKLNKENEVVRTIIYRPDRKIENVSETTQSTETIPPPDVAGSESIKIGGTAPDLKE